MNGRQEYALEVTEPSLLDGTTHQVTGRVDPHVDGELPDVVGELAPRSPTSGQEPRRENRQEADPDDRDGETQRSDVEHPQGRLAHRLEKSRDHHRRRGADDGDEPTENRRERQRHEIPRGRLPFPIGEVCDLRREHRHDGRVVQKGGGGPYRPQQTHEAADGSSPTAQRASHERLKSPGLFNRPRHYVQGGDGKGGGIGKPGQSGGRVDHPHQHEEDGPSE